MRHGKQHVMADNESYLYQM